ncbi:MAG: hypothetical protein K1X66_08130 [Verrucomicrobiae bacterium]|nr:hypothetical protein [Verrucomicrobiae bacterium]
MISPLTVVAGVTAVATAIRGAVGVRGAWHAFRLGAATRTKMLEVAARGGEPSNLAVGTLRMGNIAREKAISAAGYSIAAGITGSAAVINAISDNRDSVMSTTQSRAATVLSDAENQAMDNAEIDAGLNRGNMEGIWKAAANGSSALVTSPGPQPSSPTP